MIKLYLRIVLAALAGALAWESIHPIAGMIVALGVIYKLESED